MGAGSSCPDDFDKGFLTCHIQCPPGFKYVQVHGAQPIDRCVLFTDNSKGFDLVNLPQYDPRAPVPPQFATERARVTAAVAAMASVAPFQDNAAMSARDHEVIKSQYAGYAAESDASKKIKAVSDSLRTPRPPVQPNPIETERKKILNPLNMAVIQTVLFTILLALIELLMVPGAYASYVVFLTLCVGASAGIYLSSR
jgi:hypothetical protein